MLTLNLSAPSYDLLVEAAEKALSRSFNFAAPVPAADAPAAPICTEPPAAPVPQAPRRGRPRRTETAPVAGEPAPSNVADAVPASAASSPASLSPVAGDASQTAPASASTPATAAPPPPAAPAAANPASGAVTFDQVKEVLQKVSARDGGQGLRDVIAILNEFGVQKVKDLKTEHYGPVAAKANELLSAAA